MAITLSFTILFMTVLGRLSWLIMRLHFIALIINNIPEASIKRLSPYDLVNRSLHVNHKASLPL